jgi:hypothetical protein
MSDDAGDFNNMETRAAKKFLFLQGNVPKEIHTILTATLVGTCTIVCHRKLNLEDRRISAKSRAEKLGISLERVGSIIHEDLDTL